MPLENLDDLEAEWAAFLEDRNAQGKWTQAGAWRRDNPGEWEALQVYRTGGQRPTLTTQMGRMMLENTDAWLEAKGQQEPPPGPQIAQSLPAGTLSGTVAWTATVSGNADPGSVRFYLDGVHVLTEQDPPFGDSAGFWDSTTVANGSHTFQVKAFDEADVVVAQSSVDTRTVENVATPPPAQGNVWMLNNYDESAVVGAEWNELTAGTSGIGYSGANGGTVTRDTSVVHRGVASCKHTVAPGTTGSQRSEWAMLAPFKKYTWAYFGVALHFPTGIDWNAAGPWGAVLCQLNQNGQFAAPTWLNLGGPIDAISAGKNKNALRLVAQTGLVPGWDTPPTQYSLYTDVINPLEAGVWYEVVIGVYITDRDNGEGQQRTWWRKKDAAAWTTGGSILGKPTLEYFEEGNANSRPEPQSQPPNYSHKWGIYRGSSGNTPGLTVYYDTIVHGDSLEAVDAALKAGGPSHQVNLLNNPPG